MFTGGLGLPPYSNGMHDSLDDQPRRRVYREYIASGELPAVYATEVGVGLHYIGTDLHEAVAMQDGAQAWLEDATWDRAAFLLAAADAIGERLRAIALLFQQAALGEA